MQEQRTKRRARIRVYMRLFLNVTHSLLHYKAHAIYTHILLRQIRGVHVKLIYFIAYIESKGTNSNTPPIRIVYLHKLGMEHLI